MEVQCEDHRLMDGQEGQTVDPSHCQRYISLGMSNISTISDNSLQEDVVESKTRRSEE